MATNERLVWIDLDNSPHVPFFRPIIADLRSRGYPVLVTARDAYNVVDLLKLHQVECTTIGRHFGKNKFLKVVGLGVRATQLISLAARSKPYVAVSHGSRAQALVAKLLRIPSMIIADYEHVTHVTRPDYLILPEVVSAASDKNSSGQTYTYAGIKEDVYASTFVPNISLRLELELSETDIVVTFRPPATEAHYHNLESEKLSAAALQLLGENERAKIVLLPRSTQQKTEMAAQYSHLLQIGRMIIPKKAVDGLNLIWNSDLVISGGGTMNREAAALGVPVYSTFRGPIGAVDRYLASKGRLVLLETTDEVRQKVLIAKRAPSSARVSWNNLALESIVRHIVTAVERRAMTAPRHQGNKA